MLNINSNITFLYTFIITICTYSIMIFGNVEFRLQDILNIKLDSL